jgi:SP family facilitated glucose transporter-like MFS transporter 8
MCCRVRGLGAGLASALSYILVFLMTKFYTDVGPYLGLGGTVIVYGVIGILCLIFLYYRLPETEGKSLVEVERFFNRDCHSLKPSTT